MTAGPETTGSPVAWRYELPSTVVVVVLGPVERTSLGEVCQRTEALMASSGATDLVCDIGIFERPCAVLLDALARLRVVTRRRGCTMYLRHASADMQALFGLAGLADILPQGRVRRRHNGTP